MHFTRTILLVITLAGISFSCNIINPPEDIPSLIRVDTVAVKVSDFDQGSASHNITCIKVNIGGTTLGFFDLPTLMPCLMSGKKDLYIEPGIELNGIRGSRAVYPFFKPYMAGNFNETDTTQILLGPGKTIYLKPKFSYKKNVCKFAWMEDFEDAGVSFLYPEYSDTVFRSQKDTVKEGRYSGAVFLDKKHKYFEAYSGTEYTLPVDGTPVLLEFDYKGSLLVEFGMYVIVDNAATWNSMLYIRPVDHWNRIYIDLNSTTKDYTKDDLFRPAFRMVWDSTGAARQSLFMDNLKLIHY